MTDNIVARVAFTQQEFEVVCCALEEEVFNKQNEGCYRTAELLEQIVKKIEREHK